MSHCGGGRDSRKVDFHCLPARFMLRGHLGRWYRYLYLYLPWVRPSFGRGREGVCGSRLKYLLLGTARERPTLVGRCR